jgi:uncharacterized membrane protein YidH (DUF202 family)
MLNEAASAVLKTQPRRKTEYSLRSNIALASVAIALTLVIIAPLIMLFETAFFDENQNFVGLENFYNYFAVPLYSALYLTQCGLLVLLLSLQYFLPVFMLLHSPMSI